LQLKQARRVGVYQLARRRAGRQEAIGGVSGADHGITLNEWNLMSLQCRRMQSFLAIADFLRPQSLELGSIFIYGVRISFESFSGVLSISRSSQEAAPPPRRPS